METKITENDNKIELHYIFNDEDQSHSLDAFTRNSCEKEFLNFVKTIASELGISLTVTTEPKKEGSLIDVYNFLVSQNGLSMAVWATFILEIFKYVFPIKSNTDNEAVKLENEKSLLELIDMAKKMEESGIPIPSNIQNRLEKLYSSRKMRKQKSNFFKKLMNENKVKEIEVTSSKALEEKVLFSIPRTDFESYYLDTDKLDSIIDNNAEIEIISPVLKNGNYSWRGIYLKENLSHEYTMKDKDFKKKVIEESLSFQNGTRLECELEICRKLDENGDEFNSGYKINKVFNQYIGDAVTEMPSGKKRRQKAEMEKNQPSLFEDEFNNFDIKKGE